jgi:predicted DNA-binding transcriptional regulator AlpA
MTKLYYKDVELAETLGVCRGTIWNLVKRKKLAPPHYITPAIARWHIDDINEYQRRLAGK